MHYKNKRPKPHKGHCLMCSLSTTDGRRNGRLRTRQERAAALSEREALLDSARNRK